MNGSVRSYTTSAGATKWEYTVELGIGADGKRKQARRRGFATERAAVEAMQEELVARRRGEHIDPARTPLADYLAEWLEVTAPSRAPSTTVALRTCLKRCAPIGHHPLGKLQPQHVQRWVNDLAARLAPRTVRATHEALSRALNQAVAWGHVARNPAAGVALPKLPARRERGERAWSADEAARFLRAAVEAGDPWEALWRVLLDGQLRIGEALALRWSDLDLDAGTVRVRRTLTRGADGRWRVGERAKTPESVRDVAVGGDTVAALRRQRASVLERRLRAGPAWADDDLVFPTEAGRFTGPGAARTALIRACRRAGVRRLTAHGLRHTGATLLVLAGVPLVVVSRRLGHSGIGMTADVYSHVSADADRAAASALARLLG